MDKDIEIRQIEGDWEDVEAEIAELYAATHEYHKNISESYRTILADYDVHALGRDMTKRKHWAVFGAYCDDKIVGFITICDFDTQYDDTGKVFDLYVDEQYRHLGIASMLMDAVKAFRDYNTIELGVAVGNEDVVHFYEKQGMVKMCYRMVWKNERG